MNYENLLNEKIKSVKPSGIRKFFDIANELDDVISLSIGEPDFKTPWHITEKGIKALQKGRTWYTPNRGFLELRDEICSYINRKYKITYNSKENILVTVGGSEAIDLCIRTLINNGDEVLIPQPSFVCYEPLTVMAGGVPVIIETKAEDEFRLTPEEIENAVTEKTKLLILPYPNNPTGAIMEKEHLEEIAKVIKKHNLLVLSDEIYSELTYGNNEHYSIISIPNMKERTVVINGFSKSYAMTGWRLGYAFGPKEIIAAMTKLHQYGIMSAPTVSQYAAVEALRNGEEDINLMRDEYNTRRRLVLTHFKKMGLNCFEPRGAFYAFPCIKSTGLSSEEFCIKLLNSKKVAVVPGNAFGNSGEGYIRVSYSYSVNHIKEALSRMEEFINELK